MGVQGNLQLGALQGGNGGDFLRDGSGGDGLLDLLLSATRELSIRAESLRGIPPEVVGTSLLVKLSVVTEIHISARSGYGEELGLSPVIAQLIDDDGICNAVAEQSDKEDGAQLF